MANKIQIRRGLEEDLPNPLSAAELGFCTDTGNVYIGNGSENVLITIDGEALQEAIDDCITSLSVNGTTVTYTKSDGSTGTITTQDRQVAQVISSTDADYPILMSSSTSTTAGNVSTVNKSGTVTANPSTGTVKATTFSGALSGNATSADTATTATTATKAARSVADTSTTIYPLGSTASTESNSGVIYVDPSVSITGDTITGNLSGNATSATKLATSRTIRTNLGSTSTASFNGTANVTPGVTGTLPVGNGGTGNTTGTATYATTTADTSSTLYPVGVASGATTTLKHDTGVTMANGTVTATTFSGDLSGNATTATTATTANKVATSLTLTLNGSSSTYNGSTARSKSWYAPTGAGDAGQILTSNGSGAPSWSAPRNYATYVIAASDSVNSAGADYVCTGTADDTVIQEAISALSEDGGKIVLLEGTYNIAAALTMSNCDYLTIEGMGASTQIELASDTSFMTITGSQTVIIKDMYISTSGAQPNVFTCTSASKLYLDRVFIEGAVGSSSSSDNMQGIIVNGSTSSKPNVYLNMVYVNVVFIVATSNCSSLFCGCQIYGGNGCTIILDGDSAGSEIFYACSGSFSGGYLYSNGEILGAYESMSISNSTIKCASVNATGSNNNDVLRYGSLSGNTITLKGTGGILYMNFQSISNNRIVKDDGGKYVMALFAFSVIGNTIVNAEANDIKLPYNGCVIGNVTKYALPSSTGTAVVVNNITNADL